MQASLPSISDLAMTVVLASIRNQKVKTDRVRNAGPADLIGGQARKDDLHFVSNFKSISVE